MARRYALVTLSVLLLASCSPDSPRHSEFQPGATREQLTEQFGPPLRVQFLANKGQVVWGAIEDYWDQVPIGSSVEIWAYRSTIVIENAETNHLQAGETELYFVDDSNSVDGVGFHLKGAVYESN